MNKERWQALSPLLDRALELSVDERAAWLAALRAEDAALAADVESLLEEAPALSRERFLEGASPSVPFERSLAGQRIGAWTLISLIGQGGMGSVWLARRSDGRFEGKAAVKLLNAELLGGAGEARFEREGSVLARLAHPHVARLLDAGVSPSGQPYLVLEHVEGEPIHRYCDGRSVDVAGRLRLYLDVLDAVAHAHAHLIVHRDLKPSNVLVSTDGQVKLLDFGIAKLLEGDAVAGGESAPTRAASRALTPEFAAPEQVSGAPITTATDIYALGVLLYLLLCGRHPAGAALRSPSSLLRAIVDTDPPRPSSAAADAKTETPAALAASAARRASTPERLRRALRGDLDTIVAKALKKRPEERYGSVTALADDVQRYLDHRPISARPDTLTYRGAKFVRRNRVPVALAALAVAALIAGLAGTAIQAGQLARAAVTAREQRDFALRQLARGEAINELNAFLLHEAAPGAETISVDALLARAEEIVARQHDDPDETRVAMMVEIARLHELGDRQARARQLLERAWDLAQRSTDPAPRAMAGCALASALARSGESERADALFRRVTAELPETPRYALQWVDCELRLSEFVGDIQWNIGKVEAAQRWLAASGIRSSAAELRVSMRLADAYRLAGRFREADAAFAQAFARLSALGRDRTQAAADLLNDWALTQRSLGDPRRAEELFRRAIEIESASTSAAEGADEHVSPALLNNLSRALLDLDRLPEAAEYAERAQRAAVKAGDDTTILQSLLQIASVARAGGDAGRAAATLAELEPRMKRLLQPTNLRFSSLFIEQALVAAAHGEETAALASADRAVALAEAGLARQPPYLRLMLRRRSEIRLRFGRAEEAAADAERALGLELEASAEGAASSHVGAAYLALARARSAQGRAEEARSASASALQHLEPALGAEHPETREARRLAAAAPPAAT